jgi:hypothetical protein
MYHEVHYLKHQECSLPEISEVLVINFRSFSKYLSGIKEELLQHFEHQDP